MYISQLNDDKHNKPNYYHYSNTFSSTNDWILCFSHTFDRDCYALISCHGSYYYSGVAGMMLTYGKSSGSMDDTWQGYGLSCYTRENNRYVHAPKVTYCGPFNTNTTVYLFVKWDGVGNSNYSSLHLTVFNDIPW